MSNIILETEYLCFEEMIDYPHIQIAANKINFITGRSGTGKSTLFRLFNGTLSPSSGQVYYKNTNIMELEPLELRKEVLLISQSVYLFEGSILDNFNEFYKYREEKAPSEEEMRKYLKICNINFSLDHSCDTMSGGERQRIFIAIFLSFCPDVLMLDEPTSALDSENSHEIINNILSCCKKNEITVIIVSHDSTLVERFSENTINLEKEVI